MKKSVILALALGMMASVSALAQERPLKGPAYKNAKPSEKYAGNDVILVRGGQATSKGPEAKNQNAWEVDKSAYTVLEMNKLKGKNTRGLQGPAYKNSKHIKSN